MNRDAISRAATRPFEDGYGGYVVKYKPQPTPDGRYLALAIVSCGLDTLHTLAAVMPDMPSFPTQAEAANAGWVAGMRWVDSNSADESVRGAIRPARPPAVAASTWGER